MTVKQLIKLATYGFDIVEIEEPFDNNIASITRENALDLNETILNSKVLSFSVYHSQGLKVLVFVLDK